MIKPSRQPHLPQTATLRDVARALQVHERTVRRMVAKNEFPKPTKVGRLWRWRVEVIEEWLNNQR